MNFNVKPTCIFVTTLMMISLMGCDISTTSSKQSAQLQPNSSTGSGIVQSSDNNTPLPLQVVGQASFGTWSYAASRGGDSLQAFPGGIVSGYNDVHGEVVYSSNSVADIRNYVAANRQLLPQVIAHGGLAEVLITFRTYVSPDDYRTWVKAHDLAVTMSYVKLGNTQAEQRGIYVCPYSDLRSYVQSNKVGFPLVYCPYTYRGSGTNGQASEQGNPLPPSSLATQTGQQNGIEKDPSFAVFGVSHTRAWVEANKLQAIADDPLVYLADITPDAVRIDLANKGVADAGRAAIEVDTPFPAMQRFGLDNFR